MQLMITKLRAGACVPPMSGTPEELVPGNGHEAVATSFHYPNFGIAYK